MHKLFRHGDVLVRERALPADVVRERGRTLAFGERTGHSHRLDGDVQLYRAGAERFFVVREGGAILRHEEHAPIALAPGAYTFWIQREYVPGGERGEVRFVPVVD